MNLRDGVEELLMTDLEKMVAGEIELTNGEQVEMLKYYKQAMGISTNAMRLGRHLFNRY